MAGTIWNSEERQFIRENFLTMSCEEMAELLPGRTKRAVQHEFANMGLERPQPQVGDELYFLRIISLYYENTGKQNRTLVDVRCRCGVIKQGVRLALIVSGNTISCGCEKAKKARERTIERNTTHGLTYHPVYSQYIGMIGRCTYESHISWKNYGGRGITVCREWRESFQAFYDWAMNTGWQDGLTIDREKNDGNYEPSNCRWRTQQQQANNKRDNHLITAFGETKTAAEWSRDGLCHTNYLTMLSRLNHLGWSGEKAIATPTRHTRLKPTQISKKF